MNITSYNITDVSYHYIGLRVVAGLPDDAERKQQVEVISGNVRKLVNDRALRLMLPQPRGTFQSAGQKVGQELVQLGLAKAERGEPYQLTDLGQTALDALSSQQYVDLRDLMVRAHLETYDNLRAVAQRHLIDGPIWQPVVTAAQLERPDCLPELLEPAFGSDAPAKLSEILNGDVPPVRSKLEDLLRAAVLQRAMPEHNMKVALFRAMTDRLISLRLLNRPRVSLGLGEFDKTYSPLRRCRPAAALVSAAANNARRRRTLLHLPLRTRWGGSRLPDSIAGGHRPGIGRPDPDCWLPRHSRPARLGMRGAADTRSRL